MDHAFKFWAIVRNRDGSEMGRVEGMTRAEVERKADEMAGEEVDFSWSDQTAITPEIDRALHKALRASTAMMGIIPSDSDTRPKDGDRLGSTRE